MSRVKRRDFLKGTLGAAAAVSLPSIAVEGAILGANERFRMGVCGLNGRGGSHIGGFGGDKRVELAWLVDPDENVLKRRLKGRKNCQGSADVRKALEDTRLAAIREIWGGAPDGETFGRYVLTSYAAARMPADEAFADDAAGLVAAMFTAGLDRDAQRWMDTVEGGSLAWGILAAGVPQFDGTVSGGDLSDFFDNDPSARQAKSRLLVAGLAGLGRIDASDTSDYSEELSLGLGRDSAWSRAITRAAQVCNPGLVAMLAGLGMQGSGWERMTPLHLYHIVRALDAVGMNAEARMIAAEAVARA